MMASYMDVIEFIDLGLEKRIFPLYTKKALAKRWGVTIQVIANWAGRHDNFPKPINGIVSSEWNKVYPLFEVERYERVRGLMK